MVYRFTLSCSEIRQQLLAGAYSLRPDKKKIPLKDGINENNHKVYLYDTV
jgi:hypothetical protein